jgi:serine/threonine-protein kinase
MNSPLSSNPWIGRFIGDNQRYRLDKRLGGGGMGDVFLATDTRVGQQVALKLLKDTLVASHEMRKRFEREIAICAALQSDHIVKISDCGVTPEGYPFYTMEYLRGQTLRQLMLREKQVSVERVVNIMTQVCKGLELAHRGVIVERNGRQGEHIKVVHRDLKPDNIFLVPTDLGEWVKILDFGVAKIRHESSENISITNTFIGTFRYSAPEQIQNDKNLDATADIYSLGVILYEMLSAADPFGLNTKGNNVSEASWLFAHSYEPPKSLRSQPGCEQLSPQIEAVVMKCLEKKPSDRFVSTSQLHQALQAAFQSVTKSTIKREQIIIQSKHDQSPTTDNETVLKPLNQAVPHQPGSDRETVLKPLNQAAPHQPGSDNETVLKPLNQAVPHQPGSDRETVPKLLNSVVNNQSQALPNQSSNQNHIGASQPNQPQQQVPDRTQMQPRPGVNQPQQQVPDRTQMQPRPGVNQPQQQVPDRTQMQPRPGVNQPQQQVPDRTQMQPRPGVNQPQQQVPDNTIYQPRQEKPHKLWLIIGILAITLGLGVGISVSSDSQRANDLQQRLLNK